MVAEFGSLSRVENVFQDKWMDSEDLTQFTEEFRVVQTGNINPCHGISAKIGAAGFRSLEGRFAYLTIFIVDYGDADVIDPLFAEKHR